MAGTPIDQSESAVLFALKRIFAKLVRFAITFGVTYPILEDVLRRSYFEVASNEFKRQDKEQTDSRITLLTGLHRREVRELRATIHNDEPLTRSLESRVVECWTKPPFLDEKGRLAPLPRLASAGGTVSFDALVQQVSTDIRASVLLDEWVARGFVRIDSKDRVHFLEDFYFGRSAKVPDLSLSLAHTACDLIAGFTDRMSNAEPRPLRIEYVYCDRLSQESIEEVTVTAARRAIQNRDAINRLGEALMEADRGRPDARQRFTFCTYLYRTDMDKDPPVMTS